MSSGRSEGNTIIAIGPRNAGKTVFLTCLYYYGSTLDVSHQVIAERGEEIIVGKYLRAMRQGKWPEHTGRKELNRIILTISARRPTKLLSRVTRDRRKIITFRIPDYAGELLTLPGGVEPGILDKIRTGSELKGDEKAIVDLITSAKGHILLIDPQLSEVIDDESRTSVAPEESYDRTHLLADYQTLVNEFQRSKLAKPVLVLVTKWDAAKESSGGADESSEKYLEREYTTLMRHLRSKIPKNKLDFGRVWIENSKKGPSIPLDPRGYDSVLDWMMRVLG